MFSVVYNYLVAPTYSGVDKGLEYVECRRCHNNTAVVEQIQYRSIDEEATTVILCDTCGYRG